MDQRDRARSRGRGAGWAERERDRRLFLTAQINFEFLPNALVIEDPLTRWAKAEPNTARLSGGRGCRLGFAGRRAARFGRGSWTGNGGLLERLAHRRHQVGQPVLVDVA